MKLKEIFERVLVESGQFLLASDEIEMNTDRFLVLVRSTLQIYNKYNPYERKFNYEAATRRVRFTTTSLDVLGAPTGIPSGIADVIPVRIAGISPYFLRDFEGHRSDYLNVKAEYPWEYRKPDLFVPLQGTLDIHAWYSHELIELKPESEGGKSEWEIVTLDDDVDNFFGLLTAKFFKGLGLSRKAFTMQDLPLTTDAADLVSMGVEMEKDYQKALQDESKFWLAWA